MSINYRHFLCVICAISLLLNYQSAHAQESEYEDSRPSSGRTTALVDIDSRLAAVEQQMRSLTGNIEQIDFSLRRLEQSLQRIQTDYDMRLSKIETQQTAAASAATQNNGATTPAATVAPQTSANSGAGSFAKSDDIEDTGETAAEVASAETSVSGTLGALKMQGSKVTGAVHSPKAPALPAKPDDYGLTAQEQYDRAFAMLRQADYANAESAFKAFIDKNPKDKLAENAMYWYAETFYVRGKFGDSAVAFAEAFQKNPKGTKAPENLLKLGMSLGALEKKSDACATFASLAKNFPKASPLVRARSEQEKTRLGCKS